MLYETYLVLSTILPFSISMISDAGELCAGTKERISNILVVFILKAADVPSLKTVDTAEDSSGIMLSTSVDLSSVAILLSVVSSVASVE